MTIASLPCCFTGFQWELVLPAGQRTWRVFQLMVAVGVVRDPPEVVV
ncbi:hypothetical protein [Streptomyces anulatus]